MTAGDAIYVVLAGHLGARFLTDDHNLAGAPTFPAQLTVLSVPRGPGEPSRGLVGRRHSLKSRRVAAKAHGRGCNRPLRNLEYWSRSNQRSARSVEAVLGERQAKAELAQVLHLHDPGRSVHYLRLLKRRNENRVGDPRCSGALSSSPAARHNQII